MGGNNPQSCQSDASSDPHYFDHSAKSINVRDLHPRYQYLDDHAYQWLVAWLLRARIWGCSPCVGHGVLSELGLQREEVLTIIDRVVSR